jgi:hypothetical protein
MEGVSVRVWLTLLLLVLAACGPAPSKRSPPGVRTEPYWTRAPICHDKAGHFASCESDPVEWNECVAADQFGRCPGDPSCFDRDNRQVPCEQPLRWINTRTAGGVWRPDATMIQTLESHVRLPGQAHAISEYHRDYVGVYVEGRKMILGLYGFPRPGMPPAGLQIRDREEDLLVTFGGGCEWVTVYFDVATGLPAGAFCNGPI